LLPLLPCFSSFLLCLDAFLEVSDSGEFPLPFLGLELLLLLLAPLSPLIRRLQLLFVVDFVTLVYDLAETLDFLDRLKIALFHLFHDFERSVPFTEDPVDLVRALLGIPSVVEDGAICGVSFFFNLHAIVSAAGAFDVEGDLAAWCLALHAGPFPLETDDAL